MGLVERTRPGPTEREKRRKYQREKYHTPEGRAYARAYYLANREKIIQQQKEWQKRKAIESATAKAEAREKRKLASLVRKRARNKRWHEEHRKHRLSYMAEWRKKNKQKTYGYYTRSRAAAAKASIHDLEEIAAWKLKIRSSRAAKCHWCGKTVSGKSCHFDHVIPLSKGGPESLENLCVSCSSCNLSKKDKMPGDFNKMLRQPLLFL